MRGSVFLKLALEAMKNKKNWPFLSLLVHPFGSISQDILVRSKIRQILILWQFKNVEAYLNRVIYHFVMYCIDGSVQAIPTYRVYRFYDY